MKIQAALLALILTLTPVGTEAFAETEPPLPVAPSEAFEAEIPSIADEPKIEFMPQFSILNASTLMLHTDSYDVNYGAVLEGVPMFHASLAVPFAQSGNFRFFVTPQLGVGTVRDVYPVSWDATRAPGHTRSTDRVRLIWIPVSVSTEVRYAVPGIPFFQPSLTAGAGGHLLLQRNGGELPNQDFWVPHLFVRPALTFFDAATTAHWFGGFSFGVSWYRSVGTESRFRGTSFDLSLKFIL